MERPIFTNRLIHEKSPYLLQHAHNPVDWYPWGDEAFREAREQDKPIFLSIGYATCHWCHVMEKESFENVEVAKLLNDTFINIKVDREEHPEVDGLYMEFAQAMMSGLAGWPLNLVLTPDLKPFFSSTYLPAETMRGFLGMKQLILKIHEIWSHPEERENVIQQAGKIVDAFAHEEEPLDQMPEEHLIQEGTELLFKTADPVYGGSKGAPKFPMGIQCCYMLHYSKQSQDGRALFYAEKTLQMMYKGGIFDHLEGGFSRYSVDEAWMIPHFEKMLSDNAILIQTYTEMYQYTRQTLYREIAEKTIQYVLDHLQGTEGAFYSAEDADSEGEEGKYYTWNWQEVHDLLGKDAPLFCDFYCVFPIGNFSGKNVLHMPLTLEEFAIKHQLDENLLFQTLEKARNTLLAERKKRAAPSFDDKVITSLNGLAIFALVQASIAFNEPKYLQIAEKAAQFIKDHLFKDDLLYRRWRDQDARFEGCLDDYAFMTRACLALFQTGLSSEWLEFAMELSELIEERFASEQGGFYFSSKVEENLPFRRAEFFDSAEPSGNGIQAENLIILSQITQDLSFLDRAAKIFRGAREYMEIYPPGACTHLISYMHFLDQKKPTIIISLNDQQDNKKEIVEMIRGKYLPHSVVFFNHDQDERLKDILPVTRKLHCLQNKTTVYVCSSSFCYQPEYELSKIWQLIDKL